MDFNWKFRQFISFPFSNLFYFYFKLTKMNCCFSKMYKVAFKSFKNYFHNSFWMKQSTFCQEKKWKQPENSGERGWFIGCKYSYILLGAKYRQILQIFVIKLQLNICQFWPRSFRWIRGLWFSAIFWLTVFPLPLVRCFPLHLLC